MLQTHPRHWGWLFVGLMRALWAAEEGDERGCRAWWAVAHERGLGKLEIPDIYPVLLRLQQAADRMGWADVVARAREHREALERVVVTPEPSTGLDWLDVRPQRAQASICWVRVRCLQPKDIFGLVSRNGERS